jgi:hypothetical protein
MVGEGIRVLVEGWGYLYRVGLLKEGIVTFLQGEPDILAHFRYILRHFTKINPSFKN